MTDFFEITVESELAAHGSFAACAKGESMRPMLRGGKDMVVIVPLPERLKKYDVILFKDNLGRYVLHRIVKIKDTTYITRGDNTYFVEYVKHDKIIGILSKYNKNGKSYDVNSFSYRFYARCRVFFYPVRKLYIGARRRISALLRKIFKKRNLRHSSYRSYCILTVFR